MPDRLRRHYWIYRIERDHLVYKGTVLLFFLAWGVLMALAAHSLLQPILEPNSNRTRVELPMNYVLKLAAFAAPLAVINAVMAAIRRFKVGTEVRIMELVPLVGFAVFAAFVGLWWGVFAK